MNCTDYYGRLNNGKLKGKDLSDYAVKESESSIFAELKEMEHRLKNHILEHKRVILNEIKKNNCKCKKNVPINVDTEI